MKDLKVVDSSGWVEYFLNGPLAETYAEFIQKSDHLITPSIAIYEVYKKIKLEVDETSALSAAQQMQKTHVVALSDELALSAADLSLRYQLAMADSMIYATAEAYGAELITSDVDFKDMPGVQFISPDDSLV